MNRRSCAAVVAFAAFFCSVDAAVAGSPSTQFVRIKNLGATPIAVYAANGMPTEAQVQGGARLIAANGVAQFTIRQGAAVAFAVNPAPPATTAATVKASVPKVAMLPFNFPRSRYVYLVTQLAGGVPIIDFALPGYRF